MLSETTEVAAPVILSEAQAIAKYNELKADIAQRKEAIEKAVVKDKASYEILHMNLVNLKKITTDVEKRRKEVNAPAKKFTEFNNEMAKQIIDNVETEVIPVAKKKLKVYDDAEAEKQRKIQDALDEKNRIAQEKLDAETARKNKILAKIKDLVIAAQKSYNEALEIGGKNATLEALKVVKKEFYTNTLDNKADFEEFQSELEEALDTIFNMGKAAYDDVKAGKYDKVEVDESIMETLDASAEQIQEENHEKTAEIIASGMSLIGSSHRSGSYRKTWTFKVVDQSKVKEEFKTVNSAAVNAWISNMKKSESEDLVDGKIIDGIKLVLEENMVLR